MQDAQGENTGVWVFSKEGGGILSGWVTAMMMAGQMRPHFSLGERNGRARSKRDIGGGFRFWPTVAAIRFPAPGGAANRAAFAHRRASRSAGAEHPPTGAHPRIRLAFSATGSASADSSKAACLLRHRRRCAAFPYSGLHSRGTGGRWSMGQLPLTTYGAAAKREAEPVCF